MKVNSYNSRVLNPQEQKLSTLDRELLGLVHAFQVYEILIIGSPHPIHVFADHKTLLHCFTKKGNLSPRFYRAQMQLTKFSKFTPPQIDFAILQNNSLTSVHYFLQHEKILPHQKHDSHAILADYGTDQFSIRINDKSNDIIVKPLDSFSFKSITPFQNKYKIPAKNLTNPYINNLYSSMILMSLVMMMTIYTLVFQILLQFLLLIKAMTHIKHPLLHVLTVRHPS